MRGKTAALWAEQDRHEGDRARLFRSVGRAIDTMVGPAPAVRRVLYPGSFVDVAPSFVWPSVTYVDTDRRAAAFFGDRIGVRAIIAANTDEAWAAAATTAFVHGDYATELGLARGRYDLLISLYAGPVSLRCIEYLGVGGLLLVNPSHGDVALAALDARYRLVAVVRSGSYSVSTDDLDSYLVPKRPSGAPRQTVESVLARGRGIAYTRSPFAYLFRRIS